MRFWKSTWFRRVFASVVISTLFYAAWLITDRQGQNRKGNRELEAAHAEADAADPNWRWEQLNAARTRPPTGQNAADLIPRIKALQAKDWAKWYSDSRMSSLCERPGNVRFHDEVLTEARRDLANSADALKLARTLRDFPQGFREYQLAPNPINTILDDTVATRFASDLLRWDVAIAVEEGDYSRAGGSLLAAVNASRSIGDEPLMISQLIRIGACGIARTSAERAVAQAVTPEQVQTLRLEQLQAAFAREAGEPLFLYGLRGERAVLDRLLEHIQNGVLDDATVRQSGTAGLSDRLGAWRVRGRIPTERADALRYLSARIVVAALPVDEQPTAMDALPGLPDDHAQGIASQFLPAVDTFANRYWRHVAQCRCAVAGLAVERFRVKTGRWPESLAEVCPEFLQAVPRDPFDRQPLRYARFFDGVAVHSVGAKLPRDRVSAAESGLPIGVDIGFRLWNLEARRLAPPPDPKPADRP